MKPRPIQIGVELVDENGNQLGSFEEVLRRVVRVELERLVQSPEDRELVIRALIRDELASMGGDVLGSYDGHEPEDRAMLTLGGYMLERFGERTVVEATAHGVAMTSGGS